MSIMGLSMGMGTERVVAVGRQQIGDVARLVRRQPREHVLDIRVGVVVVVLGRLDHADDLSRAVARRAGFRHFA